MIITFLEHFVGTQAKWNSSDLVCKVLLVYPTRPSLDQNIYPVLIQNLRDCVFCLGVQPTEPSALNAFLVLLWSVLLYSTDTII